MHWSPLGWVRTHFKCVAFGRCAAETKKEYIHIKKKKKESNKIFQGNWDDAVVRTAASYRAGLGSFLRPDVTCGPCSPSGLFPVFIHAQNKHAKFHSGFYPNSDSFDKITYWLVLFYRVSFLASWLTLTYKSAQNDLTGATARAYSNQDTKCNHTLRDRAVTLTSGLFLHRRHHPDYRWSERSTALHSYLLCFTCFILFFL